ncbi:oligoendopeptidase F [Lutispora thermophila]|uniref:Oligopeptidase F n=1 Tax=Lutispora thermophila DSM 19022 TaxID=1122184 RepID=A0A1M6EWT6_9FIRM|nr:oligoendopeptidase F [Lutispora thermophila]SHI89876.1 oligopeptidase F. Metallo peptidase. MEROPS family M03B [Lutispora thermophila DSM 19022]
MKIQASNPKREEIKDEFKWKLEHIYESVELWEEDFKKVKNMVNKLSEYNDRIAESSDNLLESIKLSANMSRLFEKLHVYAHMKSHENTANSFYQSLADRADALGIELEAKSSFMMPEIISISDDDMEKFYKENNELGFYKRYLDEIRRMKPYVLSKNEEEILAMAGELAQAPGNIFDMYNNADIKFPMVKNDDGKEIELTKGRYMALVESSNREVRKNAYTALYSTYKNHRNTLAAMLNANVKANIFNAKVRKYKSAREAAMFPDNVPIEVYDNLIDTIHNKMHLMYRYMALRKKLLGLDELQMYDIYAPMVKDVNIEIPYAEAKDTVKKGLSLLGEEYVNLLDEAYENGWIDVYENQGKISGAYSWGCYDSHPYVLMNYNDTLDSMFTLAHELGHAMHSYYSDKNQDYVYSQYKIFVAEVASTTNEALLMDYMLKNTQDKKLKMYLLNHYLEQFRATVYRQTMFAEFEKVIHEKVESGESLTADLLSEIYANLNKQYYGPDVEMDEYIEMEWARIPHFYSSFYVYKYATGFSAAIALSSKIINQEEGARSRYLEFLKSGGADYPIELLRKAGVDMTTPEPIEKALMVFENLLNEMENMVQ